MHPNIFVKSTKFVKQKKSRSLNRSKKEIHIKMCFLFFGTRKADKRLQEQALNKSTLQARNLLRVLDKMIAANNIHLLSV